MIIASLFASVASAAPVQLAHQGRLVDAAGRPYDGVRPVTVALYDHATLGGPTHLLHDETVGGVVFASGHYAVTLGGAPGDPLSSDVFANPEVWLELTVDGTTLAPRERIHHVPLAAYAASTGAARLDAGGTVGTACSPIGAIAFDTALDALKVCASTGWTIAGANQGIVVAGSGRRWADGTYARTCKDYLTPVAGYTYTGVTGDGTYTVDPDGFGTGVSPFDVVCDMTGGGWTVLNHNFVGLTIPDKAVEAPGTLYERLTYPQTNAQIVALLARFTEKSQTFLKSCQDSLINSDYGGSYTRFELPSGSFVDSNQALWGGGARRDCDLNDAVLRSSSITFTGSNIPIMAIWGGDSGDPGEFSTFQIGAFRGR